MKHNVTQLLVSISPFHNEYIPFSKVKGYIKIVISDYPQDKERYEKDWSYNVDSDTDTRKTTVKREDNVDVYEVIMKNSQQKFTTHYLNRRFEIYIESTKLDDILPHYELAELIIEKLVKM